MMTAPAALTDPFKVLIMRRKLDSATFGHGICPDCHKKIVAPEREYLDPKGKTRAVGGFDPCEMARDVTRTCLPG